MIRRAALVCPNRRTFEIWGPFFRAIVDDGGWHLSLLVPRLGPEAKRRWQDSPYNTEGSDFIELPSRLNWLSERGHSAPLFFSRGVQRTLDRLNPTLIHVLGEASYATTWQVARWKASRGMALPMLIRGAQNVYKRYPLPFRWFEKRVFRNTDCVIANGAEHETTVRRKGYTGRVVRLPLGVDDNVFCPTPERRLRAKLGLTDFVFGYVGKLIEAKGIRDLLTAFAGLEAQPRLLLVGGGPLEAVVRRFQTEHPAGGRVIHIATVPHREVTDCMNSIDALVLPSRFSTTSTLLPGRLPVPWKEQFGRVLIEAMACGVPVIGSDSGEIPHVIGDAGLTFRSGDVDALRAQMQRLKTDAALRERLRERGLEAVRTRYSWRVITGQLLDLWNELISGPDSEMETDQ